MADILVAIDAIETYVAEYARTIAENAPLTVHAVKAIVAEAQKDESEQDVDFCAKLVVECFASNDYVEGRRAFMDKRKPAFTGT